MATTDGEYLDLVEGVVHQVGEIMIIIKVGVEVELVRLSVLKHQIPIMVLGGIGDNNSNNHHPMEEEEEGMVMEMVVYQEYSRYVSHRIC